MSESLSECHIRLNIFYVNNNVCAYTKSFPKYNITLFNILHLLTPQWVYNEFQKILILFICEYTHVNIKFL